MGELIGKYVDELFWVLVVVAAALLFGYFIRTHGATVSPVKVTVAGAGTLALPALDNLPTPTPMAIPSPPVAAAAASARVHVTIRRPVWPGGRPLPSPGASADPTASDGMETITIDMGTDAVASAPVVVVTPAPAPPGGGAIADPERPGMIGAIVGSFPGTLAVDLQPVRFTLFGRVEAGPTLIFNTKAVGLGATLALPEANRHLYLEGGAFQPLSLVPAAGPYIGLGYRF